MNKKYDPIPKSQENIDAFEEDKKKFVVSTSKWIKLSDIEDWDIFDPKRMYVIKDDDDWPIFIIIDSPEGKIKSSNDVLDGMDFDEFLYRFIDNYFIKEFKNN